MTAVELPPLESLSPAVQEIFKELKRQLGTIPNVYRMLAGSPEILESYHSHIEYITREGENLDVSARLLVAILVARLTNCQYCYGWFSLAGKQYGIDSELLVAVGGDYRKSAISNRLKAILAFAEKITTSPFSISDRERERLREVGLSDSDVVDVAALAACANSLTRLVLALGVPFER